MLLACSIQASFVLVQEPSHLRIVQVKIVDGEGAVGQTSSRISNSADWVGSFCVLPTGQIVHGMAGAGKTNKLWLTDADTGFGRVFVGSGKAVTPGTSAADGAATAADFGFFASCAVGSDGALYVLDAGFRTVRKVTYTVLTNTKKVDLESVMIETIMGLSDNLRIPTPVVGDKTVARFIFPTRVTYFKSSAEEYLYILDSNKVLRMTTTGTTLELHHTGSTVNTERLTDIVAVEAKGGDGFALAMASQYGMITLAGLKGDGAETRYGTFDATVPDAATNQILFDTTATMTDVEKVAIHPTMIDFDPVTESVYFAQLCGQVRRPPAGEPIGEPVVAREVAQSYVIRRIFEITSGSEKVETISGTPVINGYATDCAGAAPVARAVDPTDGSGSVARFKAAIGGIQVTTRLCSRFVSTTKVPETFTVSCGDAGADAKNQLLVESQKTMTIARTTDIRNNLEVSKGAKLNFRGKSRCKTKRELDVCPEGSQQQNSAVNVGGALVVNGGELVIEGGQIKAGSVILGDDAVVNVVVGDINFPSMLSSISEIGQRVTLVLTVPADVNFGAGRFQKISEYATNVGGFANVFVVNLASRTSRTLLQAATANVVCGSTSCVATSQSLPGFDDDDELPLIIALIIASTLLCCAFLVLFIVILKRYNPDEKARQAAVAEQAFSTDSSASSYAQGPMFGDSMSYSDDSAGSGSDSGSESSSFLF